MSAPLVAALRPVRTVLQRFLTDSDAARLLRVSRTLTIALLPSFTFRHHPFEPTDTDHLHRLHALLDTYSLRIDRLALPSTLPQLRFDSLTRRSPIPASVTTLLLGPVPRTDDGLIHPHCIVDDAISAWLPHALTDAWYMQHPAGGEAVYRHDFLHGSGFCFIACAGQLNGPLPPQLLPQGLRQLVLSDAFDCPFDAGSLPASLTFLQCGARFNQPLHHLPPSLDYLVMGASFNSRIERGQLPPSLTHLELGVEFDQPIDVGVLPAGLQALDLSNGFNQPLRPGCLPPALTHLCFGRRHSHAMPLGTLPSSLQYLSLGVLFFPPLIPGFLPPSLRVLVLGVFLVEPLQPGVLPHGLEMLQFRSIPTVFEGHFPLQPGVLPSTLLALDLGECYAQPIAAGVIPVGLRWLKLSAEYRGERVEAMKLSPTTELLWYSDDFE